MRLGFLAHISFFLDHGLPYWSKEMKEERIFQGISLGVCLTMGWAIMPPTNRHTLGSKLTSLPAQGQDRHHIATESNKHRQESAEACSSKELSNCPTSPNLASNLHSREPQPANAQSDAESKNTRVRHYLVIDPMTVVVPTEHRPPPTPRLNREKAIIVE